MVIFDLGKGYFSQMKIESLKILNFRGIREASLNSLGNMVIIAGQNGSGKSCIFDAIRLLKSAYGGYQPNELQHWMNEFRIHSTNSSDNIISIFNDPSKELRISCEFSISEQERQYIKTHAQELLDLIPHEIFQENNISSSHTTLFSTKRYSDASIVNKSKYDQLMSELRKPTLHGEFYISPERKNGKKESFVLSLIFSSFRLGEIGIIDYHGAQRNYGRELIQGVNLNIEEHQRTQLSLYDTNKYNNIKGEMAASYIKEILAEKAGILSEKQISLTDTLKELFVTFFPEKEFLGPQATKLGMLDFLVRTKEGNTHDLDELSSGEKEVLYGYLRIKNSAPKHSIVLIDEPELHLNPRLIRNLPEFYRKNLGEILNNQIWLITHSDALLREVVDKQTYNVFHMIPCKDISNGENQLKLLSIDNDLNRVIIDLVGDLAFYHPERKLVILEGGGDSKFDKKVVSSLFPDIQEKVNLISGTNKTNVRALHELLKKTTESEKLPFKIYSITDKDLEKSPPTQINSFLWDVYHIENYLLEPLFIKKVLSELDIEYTETFIYNFLKECAKETIHKLVRNEIEAFVNKKLVESINTKGDPKITNITQDLNKSIDRSIKRINDVRLKELNEDELKNLEAKLHNEYEESFNNDTWKNRIQGREVLKQFIGNHGRGKIKYEIFRNLILARMKDAGFQVDDLIRNFNYIIVLALIF